MIHNVAQWPLEIQPILDNGDNRSPQVNVDFLHLFLPAVEPSGLWLVPEKFEAMEWNSGGMGWTKLIGGTGFGQS